MKTRPRILAFRDHLLPLSETFVVNQTLGLENFEAYLLGSKPGHEPRIQLPPDRMRLINPGTRRGFLREILFKFFGMIPRDILDWCRSVRPVLIHAHFGPDGSLAMPLAERLKVPLIVSYHGSDATVKDEYSWGSSVGHRLYRLRRKKLVRTAQAFVTPSRFVKAMAVRRQGIPEHKIEVIPHGIDLNRFRPDASPKPGRILFVGRLVEQKGLHHLIEAAARIRDSFPQLHLRIVGDGPDRSIFETLARNKLGAACTFLGALSHDAVRHEMQKAYVFCMPTLRMPNGEAESFGMVYVEAQACGVPVVGYAVGGVPEVVLHGETGFLAPEHDASALTSYLKTLMENDDLRNAMGRAGRAWVEGRFDRRVQNTVLENLYRRVCGLGEKP
ncbi:MAG: glycosyltransferase [Desulfosoma sp.]